MSKRNSRHVEKQSSITPTIIVAVLGLAGTIIAAYFGYLGIQSQIAVPINATQTAEAKLLPTRIETLANSTTESDYLDITPTISNSYKLFDAMTWLLISQDSFDSNDAGWPLKNIQKEDTTIYSEVKNGTYYWEYSNNLSTWYWFDIPLYSYSNFYLSIKVRRLSDNYTTTAWYGIAFRAQGNNAYIFYINDSQKYYFGIYDNEKWTDIIGETKISQITLGEFNEIGVIADGSQISLFINKTPVGTVTDNTLSQGKCPAFLGRTL